MGNPELRANSGNISSIETGQTRDIAAAKAGLGSGKTLEAAQKVIERDIPELVEAMDRGKVTSAKSLLSLVVGAWAKTVKCARRLRASFVDNDNGNGNESTVTP